MTAPADASQSTAGSVTPRSTVHLLVRTASVPHAGRQLSYNVQGLRTGPLFRPILLLPRSITLADRSQTRWAGWVEGRPQAARAGGPVLYGGQAPRPASANAAPQPTPPSGPHRAAPHLAAAQAATGVVSGGESSFQLFFVFLSKLGFRLTSASPYYPYPPKTRGSPKYARTDLGRGSAKWCG